MGPGPPEGEVTVLPPSGFGQAGGEEAVHPDQVPEALGLPDGEGLVGPPARLVVVLAPLGGHHHGAQLVEHVVVREAGEAVVEPPEAVQEAELVERGQAVLGGVRVVEVHLGQLVGGEQPVAVEHGQDGPVPFGQPVRHCHHEPIVGPRLDRRSIHANNPKESGFATGRGDGDRGGDPAEPPHLAYPARRTLVYGAARLIVGPSTKGSRFAFWEAGSALLTASELGESLGARLPILPLVPGIHLC